MNFTEKILFKIKKKGRGWVFSPKDFVKIRHYNTINPLLDRLEKRGEIRSLGKGLYDLPIIDESGEYLEPELDCIIKALQIQYGEKFQYGGEYSAYLLGLIDKKPNQIIYLTNGKARKIKVRGFDIIIKRTNIPSPAKINHKSFIALQAIIYLGKRNTSKAILEKVVSQFDVKELTKFNALHKYMPIWLINLTIQYLPLFLYKDD